MKHILDIHPDYWDYRKDILSTLRQYPFVEVRAYLKVYRDSKRFELRFSKFNNYCARAILELGIYLGKKGLTKHWTVK